jgi:hypothetical protein
MVTSPLVANDDRVAHPGHISSTRKQGKNLKKNQNSHFISSRKKTV